VTSHHAHTPLHAVDKSALHSHRSGLVQGRPLCPPDLLPARRGRAEGTPCPTHTHTEGASGLALRWARCWKHRHVYMCKTDTQGARDSAVTRTDVLSRTHSSYKDDGKGTLNPLTTHWEEHTRRSELYQV